MIITHACNKHTHTHTHGSIYPLSTQASCINSEDRNVTHADFYCVLEHSNGIKKRAINFSSPLSDKSLVYKTSHSGYFLMQDTRTTAAENVAGPLLETQRNAFLLRK